MTHLWHVFRYELTRSIRRRGYLFVTFGVPLLSLLVLLVIQFFAGRSDGNLFPGAEAFGELASDGMTDVGYVDQADLLTPADSAPLTAFPNEDAARAMLDAGEIDGYYVIPPDYLETGSVTLVLPRLRLTSLTSGSIQPALLNALERAVDDPALFERLRDPANFERFNLQVAAEAEAPQNEGALTFVVYIFALVLMMSLLVTSNYLMQSVIEEKENRMVEILLVSVRPTVLLTGKLLAYGALGLLQMLVWLGGTLLLWRIGGGGAVGPALGLFADFAIPAMLPLWLLIYFVLTYLLFGAAFSIAGVLTNSTREGAQYTVVFVLPLVSPLWFLPIFTTTPNAALPVFLSLFPLTAPVAMIQRLALTTVPLWQIAASLGLLALTTLVMMWLTGRIFRVQMLLRGNPPKLRELPRLLWQG